jgi:uncharacterized protein
MSFDRQRNAAPPTVQSPCVRNCCLDNQEICLGCGRSLEEILQWGNATAEQRELILQNAAVRREHERKQHTK